jgi:hypothetical protein
MIHATVQISLSCQDKAKQLINNGNIHKYKRRRITSITGNLLLSRSAALNHMNKGNPSIIKKLNLSKKLNSPKSAQIFQRKNRGKHENSILYQEPSNKYQAAH